MWTVALWSGTWEASAIADVQRSLLHYLRTHYKEGIWAGVEIRVPVKETRFRIPDATVTQGAKPTEQIIQRR